MATKKTPKKAPKAKAAAGSGPFTKSALINALVEANGDLSRKQVVAVLSALSDIGCKQLKKVGVFTVPGFAKFRVRRIAARKAERRMNPFTKQEQMYPAKPARNVVRARPVKALKEACN
jgi:DNA-binding protein HU-beta